MAWKPVCFCSTAFAVGALVVAGCQTPPAPPLPDQSTYPLGLATSVKSGSGGPPSSQGQTQTAPSPIQQVAATQPADKAKPPASLPPLQPAQEPANAPLGLSLSEAIETGLTRNPDLITQRQAENVGAAVLGVARTPLFNPTVQARILPYNKFADGTNAATYNYVLLWQQFELAHQRHFRSENASAALNGIRWTIHQAELMNVALTEQLYFTALYQRGLRDLADMTARVNETLLSVMERRLKGGQASAADVAMVRFDTHSSRQQARLAAIGYQNAVLALRRQLNLPPDAPLELPGELTDFTWQPINGPELCRLVGDGSVFANATGPEALAAELASHRPDVLAAKANAQAGQANVRLAKALRVPNLWLGPFYSRDSEGIVSVGFQTQMDIPVVNTGKPLVRQREAEMQQLTVTAQQLEAKARIEARTALERYERARRLMEQTRGVSGQQVPEELQKLEAEFRKGEIDILRITQARNSLLLFRRTHLDSLNELALAAAAVTAATGLPPAALVVAPTPPGVSVPPCNPAEQPACRPAATLSFGSAE
jgi:outer membrane protein, heavy metal efflux system